MDFYAVLDQIVDLLHSRGRVSYRALKVQFHLDDEELDALKEELLYAHQGAVEEDGPGLVWTARVSATPTPTRRPGQPAQVTERWKSHLPESLATSRPACPRGRTPPADRAVLRPRGFDRLASQLDPEDLREVVRAYHETCAKVIARYEGYIAQYLGDGMLVYFGYPLAHEDDAQRAVRAGLGILEAIGQLNTRLAQARGVQLAVRLGIHTGLVVVGEVGGGARQEHLALGETPNLAARLQGHRGAQYPGNQCRDLPAPRRLLCLPVARHPRS